MSSNPRRLLAAAAAEALQGIREDREQVGEDRVKAVLAQIEEHLFDRELTGTTLQHHCGIHDNRTPRLFAAALGVTPRDYIHDRRAETAGRLLVDTNLGLRQIAELVGYSGTKTFSYAFRRSFRVRPSAYRRAERKRLAARAAGLAPTPGSPLPEPMLREIPITRMWRELPSLPDQLAAWPGAVAVTRRGEPVLAVMSWKRFESLLEIIED